MSVCKRICQDGKQTYDLKILSQRVPKISSEKYAVLKDQKILSSDIFKKKKKNLSQQVCKMPKNIQVLRGPKIFCLVCPKSKLSSKMQKKEKDIPLTLRWVSVFSVG